MRSSLPVRSDRRLARIGQFADSLGLEAYLVGGAVRDLLSGKKLTDLDFSVEKNPLPLVKKAASEFGGKIVSHGRFGTFTLAMRDGRHIDFATAREESYPQPAVLPTVKKSTIRKDLFRRDFTINAMALRVGKSGARRLLDPCGGRKDLEKRILRVLHPRSFRDDPTRIYRLARFASRGYRIDPVTVKYLKRDRKFARLLTRERVREELLAILSEKNPAPALRLLMKWKIADELSRIPAVTGRLGLLQKCGGLPERIAVLIKNLSAAGRLGFLEGLRLSRRLKSEVQERLAPGLPRPVLNGDDLKRIGYRPGPRFKLMLSALSRRGFRSRRKAVKFLFDKFPQKS
ncbi:MAG: CCA tRNA nucleotidyltransferase [Endomicrobiales bacterium]|nr:CCA tRNA nucleotidyltransferase [Endomicrobiales bacterium]